MRLFNKWAAAVSIAAVAGATVAACSGPDKTAAPAAATAPVATPAPVPATDAAVPPAVAPAPIAEPVPEMSAAPAATRPAPARPAVRPAPAVEPRATIPAPAADPAPAPPPVRSAPPAPVFTEVTVPSGTTLAIELKTGHASDTSQVEETVRGVLRRPLLVAGQEIAPAGASVTGHVTAADQAGKVKGRARLVLRFSSLVIDDAETPIATVAIAREAASTKKEDAAKIGIGAGAGAIIGAIAGGKKGAVVGGTVGAGAGTGVVLATRGDEVQLPAGTAVSTTLSQPLVVRVRMP